MQIVSRACVRFFIYIYRLQQHDSCVKSKIVAMWLAAVFSATFCQRLNVSFECRESLVRVRNSFVVFCFVIFL